MSYSYVNRHLFCVSNFDDISMFVDVSEASTEDKKNVSEHLNQELQGLVNAIHFWEQIIYPFQSTVCSYVPSGFSSTCLSSYSPNRLQSPDLFHNRVSSCPSPCCCLNEQSFSLYIACLLDNQEGICYDIIQISYK